MVILRMNRSFDRHGKKFLILLTGLISIAFIGFFTPGESGCAMGSRANPTIGTSFGENVSANQLNQHNLLIQVAVQGQANEAFLGVRGITAFKAAQKMGVSVTDMEAKDFIRKIFTDKEGKFNKVAFKNYEDQLKSSNHISSAQFLTAVKRYLSIVKFFEIASVEALVTADEMGQINNQMNEVFDVDVTWFKNEDFAKNAIVTDTAIRAKYDGAVKTYQDALVAYKKANNEQMALSKSKERVSQEMYDSANTTLETATKALESAEKNVWMTAPVFDGVVLASRISSPKVNRRALELMSEGKLKAYYESNKLKYASNFETSKDSVRRDLLPIEKSRVVRTMLQEFLSMPAIEELSELPADKRLTTFVDVAKKEGFEVIDVKGFCETSMDVPGIGTEPEVLRAFESTTNTSSEVSHVVGGFGGAYLVFCTHVVESTVKPFDQAKAEIIESLKKSEGARLASDAARQFVVSAEKAISEKLPVTSISGANFQPVPAFALNPDSVLQAPYFDALAQVVVSTPRGKVSRQFYTQEGYGVAFVKDRKAAKDQVFDINSSAYKATENMKNQMIDYQLMLYIFANSTQTRQAQ